MVVIDSCISLTYAEIYIALAITFRRFEFEIYDTTRDDVNAKHDFFVASPKLDSKGIRAKVTKCYWLLAWWLEMISQV